ncbi:hypothetical protein [Hyunsoonleella pacifica]|uniref:Lipoprotein n=1 Tax=Hyunsoonleella pacifica TaxID=1080224 RepID=A0A4Q9FNV6_9FLAO|nr:hypothetical protein [Hyunsoonleella pacifica]TBN15664.1 hypothetical protein EYD46_11100 [Hyunsoonleella pacifica]GGD21658.1 hypothetical protein GCM10011368_24580 [Hyunsoonleella pacifica]
MRKILSLMFLVSLFFVGCDKEEAPQNDLNAATELSVDAEVTIEETEEVLDNIVLYSESSYGVTTSSNGLTSKGPDRHGWSGFFKACAGITVVETDMTITTTIVFNGECTDKEGNSITGTITKEREKTEGSRTRTVTFTDVTINGRVVNGTKQYVFTEENDNGNPEMSGSVDITIETEDGTVSKVGNRTVEITAGSDTYSWFDDEKTITGASIYTNAEGNTFTVEITTPLVKPAECKYIASGVKEYTRPEGTTVIDYGDGTCDNVATKTAPDGTVTEITLRKRKRK